MAYPTPDEAALAGDHTGPDTSVVISAWSLPLAAVVLSDPTWSSPDFVWCRLDDDGWHEIGTASGRTLWSLVENGVGVLASWAEPSPASAAIESPSSARSQLARTKRTLALGRRRG